MRVAARSNLALAECATPEQAIRCAQALLSPKALRELERHLEREPHEVARPGSYEARLDAERARPAAGHEPDYGQER